MSKLKKLILLFLVLSLISTLRTTVFADEHSVAVATSDFLAREGETFSTTVYIPDNANIVDFELRQESYNSCQC